MSRDEITSRIADMRPLLIVGGTSAPFAGEPGGQFEYLDPYDPDPGITYRIALQDAPQHNSLSGRFSGIICNAVLEHIPPLEYARCVQGLHWMLRAGGLLLIEIPFMWKEHCSDKRLPHHFGGDFCRLTVMGLESLFDDGRWRREACEYFVPPEHKNDGTAVIGLFRKASE